MSSWKLTCFAVVLLVLAWSVSSTPTSALSQSVSPTPNASGGVTALSEMLPNGIQQIVVLDPTIRSLAVYHVSNDGRIELKSVRQLAWDLQMEHFNGQSPLPSELREIQR